MCMIDGCDGSYTLLSERHRKARKEHGCAECHRIIDKNEIYLSMSVVYDGEAGLVRMGSALQRDRRGW